MLPNLKEIKTRRVNANLTQSKLAELSNVSQSLIAKIESGNIEPSYQKAKRLFDCLEQLNAGREKTALQIMTKPVTFVKADESLKMAIKRLEGKGYSQIPIFKDGKQIGSISEKGILAKIGSEKGLDIETAKAEEAMEETLPTIPGNTPVSAARQLLNFNAAVLVVEKGKITGIITKSDLLKKMIK